MEKEKQEVHHGSHSSNRVPKALESISSYHNPQPEKHEDPEPQGQADPAVGFEQPE